MSKKNRGKERDSGGINWRMIKQEDRERERERERRYTNITTITDDNLVGWFRRSLFTHHTNYYICLRIYCGKYHVTLYSVYCVVYNSV